ncbi:hypothetical protein N7527_003601 [Penicillium freii]|nr:hypothetical protein N7527_003601 [Penicillium freii]
MREGLGRRLDYSRSLRKERVNTWERTDQLGSSAFTVLIVDCPPNSPLIPQLSLFLLSKLSVKMFQSIRFSSRLPARLVRWNSTGPVLPPLMATLRTDLKTAMRAKDTTRLNVLRALISETNNAAKTASPIQTDIQLLSLIRKRLNASKDAAKEFDAAERPDLKEKEDAQVVVLEEYASQVKTLPIAEIKEVVINQIAAMINDNTKPNQGTVLKALFAAGGPLDGKPVDRKEVATEVKNALS